MNTNSAVTSAPVARGGLTADRTHNPGLDLSLVQPATYDTISPNEAREQAGGGEIGRGDIPLLAVCVCVCVCVCMCVLICFVWQDAPSALKRDP